MSPVIGCAKVRPVVAGRRCGLRSDGMPATDFGATGGLRDSRLRFSVHRDRNAPAALVLLLFKVWESGGANDGQAREHIRLVTVTTTRATNAACAGDGATAPPSKVW